MGPERRELPAQELWQLSLGRRVSITRYVGAMFCGVAGDSKSPKVDGDSKSPKVDDPIQKKDMVWIDLISYYVTGMILRLVSGVSGNGGFHGADPDIPKTLVDSKGCLWES